MINSVKFETCFLKIKTFFKSKIPPSFKWNIYNFLKLFTISKIEKKYILVILLPVFAVCEMDWLELPGWGSV